MNGGNKEKIGVRSVTKKKPRRSFSQRTPFVYQKDKYCFSYLTQMDRTVECLANQNRKEGGGSFPGPRSSPGKISTQGAVTPGVGSITYGGNGVEGKKATQKRGGGCFNMDHIRDGKA